ISADRRTSRCQQQDRAEEGPAYSKGPHDWIHRLASPAAAARTTGFTDSPRLRLWLARLDSPTRLPCGCGSQDWIPSLSTPAAATAAARSVLSRRTARGAASPRRIPSRRASVATYQFWSVRPEFASQRKWTEPATPSPYASRCRGRPLRAPSRLIIPAVDVA